MCTCLCLIYLGILLTANFINSEKCSTSTKADIVFMVDGSGSVGLENFQHAKAFMSRFVDLFNIDPSHTQIGVMIYTTLITFPIYLNSYSDVTQLKNAIDNIGYTEGSEDPTEALRQLMSIMLTSTKGKRNDATPIVIIITDGAAPDNTVTQATTVKNSGVVIYVATVGNYNFGVMNQVVSRPEYFMSVTDYSSLKTLEGPLSVSTCNAIQGCLPTTCKNGGICHEGTMTYRCACPAAYSGWYCDQSICVTNSPCGNRGACSIEGSMWKCTCNPGYAGSNCSIDINECESSPCQNGATCIDKVNMFECACADGYYNLQCETNICQPTMADVIFLLDSSVSQSRDQFTKQLEFVTQFIDHVVVGIENFQFAVITFSFEANVEIGLAKFNDNVTLKDAVRNIPFRPGGTFTHKGLQTVSELVANSSSARPFNHSARRYVILLTDGMSINRAETKRVADSLKQQIYRLIAISVGHEVFHRELLDIASPGDHRTPQYVFAVSNFNALFTIVAQLVHLTCQECTWNTTTDIVFLIDMSTEMSQVEVDLGIDSMTYLLNGLLDKHYNTTVRAALVSYGNGFRVHRTLNEPMESLRDYIQGLTAPRYCDASGDDNCDVIKSLSRALDHLNTSMFNKNGNNTREVIVMITNGRQDIDTSVQTLANNLVRAGKIMLAIGVGDNWKVDSFKQMVEDPSHVYTVESKGSLNELDSVMTEIVYSSCALSNDFNDKH